MCYGENNAGHAVSYFNSQLKGLWDISEECADQHLDPDARLKPDARQHRYSFALSEFYYGKHRQGSSASLDDMMFHAVFSSPKLRFICNHEALFRIEVEEGHFNLDYSRASESSTADRARNRDIPSGTSFEFRIPFRTTGIKGSASLIGNGSHAFTLLVLEYRRAKLMTISRETDQPSSQALESYLQTYLAFLQSAGHHVLFSLPNFSDLEEELQIDYSEVVDSPLHLQEVHGVVIADINRYLSTLWLKAAMLASGPEGQVLDRPGISLAEYRSTWISQRADIHFHLTFGAPEVVALCNDEVIVHYVIDEAYFYKSDNFDGEALRTYQNWRVAVVFDLHHEKPDEEGGNVTRCKLNMAKPRLLPQFSSFEGVEEEDQIAVRCRFRAAEFLSGEYLSVLEGGGFHVIYYHDLRWPKPGDETENVEDFVSPNEASWSATDVIEDATGKITKTAIWRNITQASDMCGFDQITALSETAINHNFHSLSATQPLLQRWGYETCFSVNFKPPTVRLRSDGRALVSFHLKDGFVRALKNWQPNSRGEQLNFTNWRVTFEVDLNICDHGTLPGVSPEWQSAFEQSRVGQDAGFQSNVDLKHISLNLLRVNFLHELSYFEGLHNAQNKRFIDKIQAAVYYLRQYYLPQLVSAGHHILYTIPIWKTESAEFPHRLTHFMYQVYSNKNAGMSYTWSDNSRVFQPIIVIVGICADRHSIPSGFQYSTEWVAHAGKFSSCGTVGISAELFLKGKLLPIVSQINATTTVIPIFSGMKQNQWNLRLTTWAEHPDRQDSPPPHPLRVDGRPDEALNFFWKHRDKLNYEHRSRSDHIVDGTYSVACDTENSLEIPTVYKQGTMTIEMRGRVTLQLDVHLDDRGLSVDWSSKASVEWTASLVVHSEAGGLLVKVLNQAIVFKTLDSTGDTGMHPIVDPEQLLRDVFPPTVDMQPAYAEFSRFASVWQSCYPGLSAYTLCNPVFSAKGDLLFELQPYTDPASAPSDLDFGSPGSPLGKIGGGRRDPFARRAGTPRPRMLGRPNSGERRPSPSGPYRGTYGVGQTSAGSLSEGRVNGKTTSVQDRVPTRSISPPAVRAPRPTRPTMLHHSIASDSRPSTPSTERP